MVMMIATKILLPQEGVYLETEVKDQRKASEEKSDVFFISQV